MRRTNGRLAALTMMLALGSSSGARAQDADVALMIRNVTVVDVSQGQLRPGVDVVLRDGVIESIRRSSEAEPPAEQVIDGEGRFLIPGLIDAHVHVSGFPHEETASLLRWALEGGVTSIRDMAGDARDLAGIQQALLRGEIPGPALFYSALVAGPPFLSDPRLQDASVGLEPGTVPYMIPLTPQTDLSRAVAAARGTGATGLKLYAALDALAVRAVTAEAHAQGLQVWAHSAIFPAKPVEILDAGVNGISHAPYVIWEAEPATPDFTLRARGDFVRVPVDDPDIERVIQAMVRNKAVLDPTLFVFDRGLDDPIAQRRLDWSAQLTRRSYEAGVTLAAGTDGIGQPVAGALPNVHTELELLVRLGGLKPIDALRAGTWGGAMAIGIADEVGAIESGKVADLVLLSADPTQDIRATRSIVHVIQAGKVVR